MPVYLKKATYLAVLIVCSLTVSAQEKGQSLGIIPKPAKLTPLTGQFTFNKRTVIRTDSLKNLSVQFLVTHLLKNNQVKISLSAKTSAVAGSSTIEIMSEGGADIPNEGYKLTITPHKISLTGKGAGLFYGVQTLIQLLGDADHQQIPCVSIEDSPRFPYRGLMLDVSRHFFSVTEVKRLIDLMAQYKLNTFQWHLTDNQGWRIEIKKYPKLTSVGGYYANAFSDGDRIGLDSVNTGGYYTQDQIKEVVKYAQNKFIIIVPEIEMPAHSAAALRAYPELKCVLPANSPNQAANDIIYCPSEQTFKFLEDVLTEVISLFPGKYIHIGGDEANKTPWEESKFCQDLMKQLNIKDVHSLQSYFIQRMEKFLNTKNRSIIGWDEILEGGLAQNATVMSWRGEKGGIAAAQQQHRVIMTPGPNGMYFDHYQSNSSFEPFNHEPGYGYAPLQKTYGYNPVPASLTPAEQKYIWGVQGNIWTEHIGTPGKLQYMTLPRIFALAEVAWVMPDHKDSMTDFQKDVFKHLIQFEKKGYNFRVPTAFKETDTIMFGGRFTLKPEAVLPGAKIYYTLNGRTPTENDEEYTKPLEFHIPANERRELQTTVITASGKRSIPARVVMYNYTPFPAATNSDKLKPGINYRVYQPDAADTATIQTKIGDGLLKKFPLASVAKNNKNFKIIFEGYIDVPANDTYSFILSAKSPGKLFIDNYKIIGDDPFSRFDNIGAALLQKGFHKIRLEYTTTKGLADMPLYWQTANNKRSVIPTGILYH